MSKLLNNKIRLSDYVASFLYKNGLNTISMVCAGSTAILNDAFYQHGKYQIIHSFRESNCAYHAIGYAKYNRKIGLINVSSGICAAVPIPQILIAHIDKVPLLVISGSVALNQNIYHLKQKYNIKNKSSQGIQDGNIIDIVKSITNYAVQIQNPLDIKYELQKCLFYCQNKIPGPVFLDIPGDIQGVLINPDELNSYYNSDEYVRTNLDRIQITKAEPILELKEKLKNSERPIALVGNGIAISDTRNQLVEFSNKYQIPIVASFLGTDLVPYENDKYIGVAGIKGSRSGNFSINSSDLILVLGCSLPNGVVGYNKDLFAPKAKLVIVDKSPEEHTLWRGRIDMQINCDLKEFFSYML